MWRGGFAVSASANTGPISETNKIDADMLPRLTGDDLKGIGVSALGDRLRLLDAIVALVDAAPSSILPRPPKPAPPTSPELTAERQ